MKIFDFFCALQIDQYSAFYITMCVLDLHFFFNIVKVLLLVLLAQFHPLEICVGFT